MPRVILAIALVLGLAIGLWWRHQPAHPAPVNASLFETDMTEHLVRGILSELKPPVPPVCFLAFGEGGTSPSSEFIARFADCQPTVRSCGAAAAPPIGQYFEISTGRPGLVVHVIRFQEFVPGTFDVLVRFTNLPAGSDRFSYRISHLAGEWKIESRKPA
jgi:hypothetical protein